MEKLLLFVALASGAMAVHKGRAALAAVDDAKGCCIKTARSCPGGR